MQSCSSSLAELSLISKFSWLLTRPYPTWLTYSDRNSYFLSISQPVLDAIQSNQDQSSSSQLDWIMHYFKFNKPFNLTLRAIISLKNNSLEITSHEIFLPSSVSTQLLSTSTSIEAEIVLFPFSDTHPATQPPTRKSSEMKTSNTSIEDFKYFNWRP